MAHNHAELQAQVDQFDLIYNTERPHQGLPGRITPQQSWDATEVAEAPRPAPISNLPQASAPDSEPGSIAQHRIDSLHQAEPTMAAADSVQEPTVETGALQRITGSITHPTGSGNRELKVYSNGVVNIGRTIFSLTASMSGRIVTASWDAEGVIFANTQGEIIADYAWPPKGTTYVGITKSRTPFGNCEYSVGNHFSQTFRSQRIC